MTKTAAKTAVIYSDIPPNEKQEAGFKEFLSKRYGEDISLVWKKVQYPGGGFRLKVGGEVYDWSSVPKYSSSGVRPAIWIKCG